MFFTSRSTLTSRIWDPRSPPSAKNYENFEKSPKISFSRLGRESFLHIPCTLRELSDTSRHVFHIDFAPKNHCQAPFPPKPRAEKWNISKICVKLVSKTHPLCSLRARRLSKHAFLPSSLKALPVPRRPGSSNYRAFRRFTKNCLNIVVAFLAVQVETRDNFHENRDWNLVRR